MDLIVADGTGSPDANTYNTLSEATTYFAIAGKTTEWDAVGDDDAKGLKLVQGFMELENKYRGKWIGQKATATQRAAWPRAVKVGGTDTLTDSDGVPIPVDAIPRPIKEAQLEVVLIALAGGSFTAQPVTKDQFLKRKKTDVLEKEWDTGKAPTQIQYPQIDQMLYGYAAGAYTGVPLLDMRFGLTDFEANQEQPAGASIHDPRYFIQG